TWTVPYSIGQYTLYDIEFVTDSIGYIIGGSNYNDDFNVPYRGLIYKTIDKGNSWIMIDSSYSFSLNKLHFTSDSIGYIAGQNGEILKISNANSLFTSVQSILSPNSRLEIYPNPTTDYFYSGIISVKVR
ncbi:MAG: WD40/YVTN/BNR-like repeat-containing protein, partial [Bacteroidia bacterium]